jgi:hypothetical protein
VVSIQIQLKFLAEEMQAISNGLEKVVQELSTSEIDGPISENFRKVFKPIVFFRHYRQDLSMSVHLSLLIGAVLLYLL